MIFLIVHEIQHVKTLEEFLNLVCTQEMLAVIHSLVLKYLLSSYHVPDTRSQAGGTEKTK